MRAFTTAAALLFDLATTLAIPQTQLPIRRLQGGGAVHIHPPTVINGLPECDMTEGPHGRVSENQADAFQGIGTCAALVTSGRYSCGGDFCHTCHMALYCDGYCGYCAHSSAETPEQWQPNVPDPVDSTCMDNETLRAAAGITDTCSDVAQNGLCNSLKSLGMLSFCCDSCKIALEQHPEYACDDQIIVDACHNTEAASNLTHGNLAMVCNTDCARAVASQYDICMQNAHSMIFANRNMYSFIYENCRSVNGGGSSGH
jgi:hypothetical protein